MIASTAFIISRPVMVLTDYQNGVPFSTTAALAATGTVLATTFATGTPISIRGASMSLNNLKQLLDFAPGTSVLDLSTGRPPFLSFPLVTLPAFQSGQIGSIELGATIGALSDTVSGTIEVRLETDAANVSRMMVNGAQSKIKAPLRIDLSDGLEIGATRIDDSGQAWLDLKFLTLFSYVSAGADLLTLALTGSEKAGRFYLRFNGLPIVLNQAPISELQANVVLDSAPNFAPRLELGDGASFRGYAAQAGRSLAFGANFFYGADTTPGGTVGLDLVDPVENLSPTASPAASLTPAANWAVGRPVLMAKPASGSVQLASGAAIEFPEPEAVPVSLDTPQAALAESPFVRLAGQVYRTLNLGELAGLQYLATSAELSPNGLSDVSFLIRDAAGALSTEFKARFHVQTASIQGSVIHAVSALPIGGAEISVSRPSDEASGARRVMSQANGGWELEGLDFDQFVISASRQSTSVDRGGSIDAADALAALKLSTGRPLGLPPVAGADATAVAADLLMARHAADVDRNGTVEISDAWSILELVAGLDDGRETGWCFVPRPAAAQTGQGQGQGGAETWSPDAGLLIQAEAASQVDWLGFLLGDVDGSWRPVAHWSGPA